MDGLDCMPPLREQTAQDGPQPLQQHTAKDAVALEHGMPPSQQLQVKGHRRDHGQLTAIETQSSHGQGLPVTF